MKSCNPEKRGEKTMTAPIKISALEPDWSREQIKPGKYEPWKRLLAAIRDYQKMISGERSRLFRPFHVLQHRFWSAVCGADIPLNSQLGGGLILLHPNGIVIHPEAKIGVNCLILQQVTIGAGSTPGLPAIGGHVEIGAGAKVLGGVKVGDHAKIGANSVVISDVPAGTTAVGVPARIVRRGN